MEKKYKLDLYKDKEKQIKFLLHLTLTFRLMPETLSELFGLSVDEINDMLFKSNVSYEGLDYLINHEFYDQDKSKDKFAQFYDELITAIRLNDKVKVKVLLNYLYDVHAINLAKNRKARDTFSNEDIRAILEYQLKYAIAYKTILDIFGINPRTFTTRFLPYLESDCDLKWRYERLSDFMFSVGGRK